MHRPEHVSDRMKTAVVIGGASCVWDDLVAAERIGEYGTLIAINDAGAEYAGAVDYWVTLHAEKMGIWVKKRAENGHAPASNLIVHEDNTVADRLKNGLSAEMFPYTWAGSSGLFACEFGIRKLRLDRIVLCGVPMNEDPHFFDPKPWVAVAGFWEEWPKALPHIKDRVRSMSGRTKELLGQPTRQWLLGAE